MSLLKYLLLQNIRSQILHILSPCADCMWLFMCHLDLWVLLQREHWWPVFKCFTFLCTFSEFFLLAEKLHSSQAKGFSFMFCTGMGGCVRFTLVLKVIEETDWLVTNEEVLIFLFSFTAAESLIFLSVCRAVLFTIVLDSKIVPSFKFILVWTSLLWGLCWAGWQKIFHFVGT